jgi:hypothetical protein
MTQAANLATVGSTATSTGKTAYPGAVLQVASTTKTDSFSASTGAFVDVTGLSVTITPSSVSSKIYVMATIAVGNSGGNARVNLLRNGSNIAQSTSGTANETVAMTYQASYQNITYPIVFLDSPASTSAQTYKLQVASDGSATIYVNVRANDNYYGSISTITVMEIAA